MRVLVMAAGCLVAASAASAQVVRLSVATDGTQANGASAGPAVSASGRYVVFASTATNLVPADTDAIADLYLRDRDTDGDGIFDEPAAVATTLLSVTPGGVKADGPSGRPVITPDGRFVAFESEALNLVPGANGLAQIYRLDRATGTIVRVSVSAAGVAGDGMSIEPAISADGNVVAFRSFASNLVPGMIWPDILVRDLAAGTIARITRTPPPGLMHAAFIDGPSISADGRRVAFITAGTNLTPYQAAEVVDRVTGERRIFEEFGPTRAVIDAAGLHLFTRRGGYVFRNAIDAPALTPPYQTYAWPIEELFGSPSGRYALQPSDVLIDFDLGVSRQMHFDGGHGAFSEDDRWLVVGTNTGTVLPGGVDTNNDFDVFAFRLPLVQDSDNDAMDDRWESLFGVSDPNADPDNDGLTNAAEEEAGTHPNGTVKRFLAEGATGGFFSTRIVLGNPGWDVATALLSFVSSTGARAQRLARLGSHQVQSIDVGALRGFEAADASITVESDAVIAINREMAWGMGSSEGARGYGSHAETATASPSASWFLAEGSTVLGFDLFYLLQNPQPTTTHATVRYLLPSGSVVTRSYELRPNSRTTIHVNAIPGLDETDVSGDIAADAPVIVERAMYRSAPGQPFTLGTGSMGVPAAATRWFLAEGATGGFFDLYVLIANPSAADAQVTAEYARPDGTVVTRHYAVRANSRFSVHVDGIAGLSDTSVSTTMTSTNGVPIVVERAMYWPGGFFDYYEGHSSPGATATARRWAYMFDTRADDRFVLIANTESRAGAALVYAFGDDGSPWSRVVDLPPSSRTTVSVPRMGRITGVEVTSTGTSPVELVVEGASYGNAGGVFWATGSNALATPIP